TPTMSSIDVINGALAVAGSKFNLLKIKGMDIPIKLPTTTITVIVRATTTAISMPPLNTPTLATASAIVSPKATETEISLTNIFSQSFILISPTAIERIMSVAEWKPALPPLSTNNGNKNTIAIFKAMTTSKLAIPAPEKIYIKTRITSQPILFRYNV